MTPQQVEFMNSLNSQQRAQFVRMPDSEKSKLFNSYLSQKSGGNYPQKSKNTTSKTNSLLSLAIDKFGSRGKQYVQENFETFGGNASGAGITAGLSGASNFLATGNSGQAIESAAISGGSNYATNFLNELISDKAIESGTSAFDSALSAGQTPVDAQIAGEAATNSFGSTYTPAAAGVVSGLTNYALTGDAGKALEAGATTGGSQYLTQYAGNLIKDKAISKALETGATQAAATQAGAGVQAAANFVPVIGGAVGAVTGFLTEKDAKEKARSAGKGAVIGTTAAMGPYGWVAAAAMSAVDVATGVKRKRRAEDRGTLFQYDSSTGEMTLH